MKKLTHSSNTLYGAPWLMEAGWFNLVCDIFDSHLAGKVPVQVEKSNRIPVPAPSGGSVAVVGVYGPILPRAALMNNMSSGGISSEQIATAMTEASQMPDVRTIVMDIDSPGGSTLGAFEAADVIRSIARDSGVEVIASINGLGASLGYLLASQANHVFASRGSRVGSIGVVAAYQEKTEPGVTRSITVAIPHGKSPHNMDDKEITGKLMADAVQYFSMFKDAVTQARGEKIKIDAAATGEVFFADTAKAHGLIDGIATLQELLDDLNNRVDNKPR